MDVALAHPADCDYSSACAAMSWVTSNQGFSEVFVTPATGFSGLSFVDMAGVRLNGVPLTPAQAAALNGQATTAGA